MRTPFHISSLCLGTLVAVVAVHGWDYEGHRTVNQVALAALPGDFPAFVQDSANAERILFLAGEPDRWRNVSDLPLRQYNVVDHYCDLEQIELAGLDVSKVPSFRYDFALQFATGRAAHSQNFPPADPAKNLDHAREWPGFAPWTIAEYYGKLKSAFSYLKAFEEAGSPGEIANAQADVVYFMGTMGHYVADCAQPLHTTVHHHGWVGENPRGYTTWSGIHSWIDGGFLAKAEIKFSGLASRIKPARALTLAQRPDDRDPLFVIVMDYVQEQNRLVESLYRLEKEGKFSNELEKAGKYNQDPSPVAPEGRTFIEERILDGGEMLAAIWLTAWKQAGPDAYLRGSLLKRQVASAIQK